MEVSTYTYIFIYIYIIRSVSFRYMYNHSANAQLLKLLYRTFISSLVIFKVYAYCVCLYVQSAHYIVLCNLIHIYTLNNVYTHLHTSWRFIETRAYLDTHRFSLNFFFLAMQAFVCTSKALSFVTRREHSITRDLRHGWYWLLYYRQSFLAIRRYRWGVKKYVP